MSRTNWKKLEKKIAKDIQGERVGITGFATPDVIKGNLPAESFKIGERPIPRIMIEAKNSKNINIKRALGQVEKHRTNKEQICVLVYKENGKKTNRVFCKFSDLKRLLKISLQRKNIIIELSYDDFKKIARGIE